MMLPKPSLVTESPFVEVALASPIGVDTNAITKSAIHRYALLSFHITIIVSLPYHPSQRTPSFPMSHPHFRFLANPSLTTILPLLEDAEKVFKQDGCSRLSLLLRHTLRWAVERMDVDLIPWLTCLQGVRVGTCGIKGRILLNLQ